MLPTISFRQSYSGVHSMRARVLWTACLVLFLVHIVSSTSQLQSEVEETNPNSILSVPQLNLQHFKSENVQSLLTELLPKSMRWMLQEIESISALLASNPYPHLSTATNDTDISKRTASSSQEDGNSQEMSSKRRGSLKEYLFKFAARDKVREMASAKMLSSLHQLPPTSSLDERISTTSRNNQHTDHAVKYDSIDCMQHQTAADKFPVDIDDYFNFIKININTLSVDPNLLSKIVSDTDSLISESLVSFSSLLLAHFAFTNGRAKFNYRHLTNAIKFADIYPILEAHTNPVQFRKYFLPIFEHQKKLIKSYSLAKIPLHLARDILEKEIVQPSLLLGYNSFIAIASQLLPPRSKSCDATSDFAKYVKNEFQAKTSNIPCEAYRSMIDELFQLNYECQIELRIKGMAQIECSSNITYLTEMSNSIVDKLLFFLNRHLLGNQQLLELYLSSQRIGTMENTEGDKEKN